MCNIRQKSKISDKRNFHDDAVKHKPRITILSLCSLLAYDHSHSSKFQYTLTLLMKNFKIMKIYRLKIYFSGRRQTDQWHFSKKSCKINVKAAAESKICQLIIFIFHLERFYYENSSAKIYKFLSSTANVRQKSTEKQNDSSKSTSV
jgi:hypothetical protein